MAYLSPSWSDKKIRQKHCNETYLVCKEAIHRVILPELKEVGNGKLTDLRQHKIIS